MFKSFSTFILWLLPFLLFNGFYSSVQAQMSIDVAQVPIRVYQYRLLNEQDEQILLSFIWSWPRSAYMEDQDFGRPFVIGEKQDQYRMTHGVHLMNNEGTVINKSSYHPRFIIHEYENIPSASSFIVPYVAAGANQVFYAELENLAPIFTDASGTPTPAALRGSGRVQLKQPPPLPMDGLLLGDLIMGYHRDPGGAVEGRFPFTVSNTGTIPNGENVVIHFELYHLQPDANGITNFEIDYDIRSVRQVLFWERIENNDDLSITLNFLHDSTQFIETIEVETENLETGNYELLLTARDLSTGQESSQTIRFSIIPG